MEDRLGVTAAEICLGADAGHMSLHTAPSTEHQIILYPEKQNVTALTVGQLIIETINRLIDSQWLLLIQKIKLKSSDFKDRRGKLVSL